MRLLPSSSSFVVTSLVAPFLWTGTVEAQNQTPAIDLVKSGTLALGADGIGRPGDVIIYS